MDHLRRDNRWNSDYDLWIDAGISRNVRVIVCGDKLDASIDLLTSMLSIGFLVFSGEGV